MTNTWTAQQASQSPSRLRGNTRSSSPTPSVAESVTTFKQRLHAHSMSSAATQQSTVETRIAALAPSSEGGDGQNVSRLTQSSLTVVSGRLPPSRPSSRPGTPSVPVAASVAQQPASTSSRGTNPMDQRIIAMEQRLQAITNRAEDGMIAQRHSTQVLEQAISGIAHELTDRTRAESEKICQIIQQLRVIPR